MEVIRLPAGERAPAASDCICLEMMADGRVNLTGSVLDAETSVALVGTILPSVEEAERDGLAWAAEHGVSKLYLARVTLA